MKIPYYLLGLLLRFGPKHGYSLREIIRREIAPFANIKQPTVYYNLEKLHRRGFVSAAVEKDGSRPEKTVYGITAEGRKQFEKLTAEILNEKYEPEFALDAVLYFLEFADIRQVTEYLRQRKSALARALERALQNRQEAVNQAPPGAAFLADSILGHRVDHLSAELEWTRTVLSKL